MELEFVAFDSFGIKSACVTIKTEKHAICIDPGVAEETGSYPMDPMERLVWRELYRARIKQEARDCDIIIITHYHHDHYLDEADQELYGKKLLLVKEPTFKINKEQQRRAEKLFKAIKGLPRAIESIDGKVFALDKLRLRFTEPMWHGREGTRLGYVIGLTLEAPDQTKLLYSSDINGPILGQYADWIIQENADLAIIDGPATYILGYILSYRNFAKSVLNLKRIVEETSSEIILDHHIMRDYRYKDLCKVVYDSARENATRLVSAAEAKGQEPMVLTAYRSFGPTKWRHWKPLELEDIEKLAKH